MMPDPGATYTNPTVTSVYRNPCQADQADFAEHLKTLPSIAPIAIKMQKQNLIPPLIFKIQISNLTLFDLLAPTKLNSFQYIALRVTLFPFRGERGRTLPRQRFCRRESEFGVH
jgi:hypothetical protein